MHTYIYAHIYIHMYMYIHMCIYTNKYIYLYIHIHVYVYVFLYMYIHANIHTCIYTHIYTDGIFDQSHSKRDVCKHHPAIDCNTLQHTASGLRPLQQTTTHCNALHNTLQQTQ